VTGAIVGVVQGESYWGGAYISRLIVDKAWRRTHKVGQALLASLLKSAREGPARARTALVSTLDFEAPGYYRRLGFHFDHELTGIQCGRSVHYFSLPTAELQPHADIDIDPLVHPAAFVIETLQPRESPCTADAEAAAAAANLFLTTKFNEYSMETVGAVSGCVCRSLNSSLTDCACVPA
jgi:hypothetical protein